MAYELLPQVSHDEDDADYSDAERHPQNQKAGRKNFYSRQRTTVTVVLILNLVVMSSILLNSHPILKFWIHQGDHVVTTQFLRNDAYQSLDHAYDPVWDALLANRTDAGLIHLSNLSSQKGTSEKGGISMFHQLHCLRAMRRALQDSQSGKDIGIDWRDNEHWPHCFDYLVKVILCFADDTIEQPTKDSDGREMIDGYDDPRKCRPSEPIYELYAAQAWTRSAS